MSLTDSTFTKITCVFLSDNYSRYYLDIDLDTYNHLENQEETTTVKTYVNDNGETKYRLNAHVGVCPDAITKPEKGKTYHAVLELKPWKYENNTGLKSTVFLMQEVETFNKEKADDVMKIRNAAVLAIFKGSKNASV